VLPKSIGRRTMLHIFWICLILPAGEIRGQSPPAQDLLRHAAAGDLLRCSVKMPIRANRAPALIEARLRDETALRFEMEPLAAVLIADSIHVLTGQQPEVIEISPTYNPWTQILAAATCLLGILGCIKGLRYRSATRQIIDVEPIDRPSLSDQRSPYLNSGHSAADAALVLGGLGAVGLLAFLQEILPTAKWLGDAHRVALLFTGIVAYTLLLWGIYRLPRWGVAGGGALWTAARSVWIFWCFFCVAWAGGYLIASKQSVVPTNERIQKGPAPPVLLSTLIRGTLRDLCYTDWYGLERGSLRRVQQGCRLSGRLVDGTHFERILDIHSAKLLLETAEAEGTRLSYEGIEKDPVTLEAVCLHVPSLHLNCALPLGGLVITLLSLLLTKYKPLALLLGSFLLHAIVGLSAVLPIGPRNPLPLPADLLWTPLSALALFAFIWTMPTQVQSIRPKRPSRRRHPGPRSRRK